MRRGAKVHWTLNSPAESTGRNGIKITFEMGIGLSLFPQNSLLSLEISLLS